MTFRTLGNRVLIKRLDEPNLKSSIITVISDTKEPGQYALVAGVGPGYRLPNGKMIPIDVKEGDLIILAKYSGAAVTLTNEAGVREEFQIVNADDVLAIVAKPTAVPVV